MTLSDTYRNIYSKYLENSKPLNTLEGYEKTNKKIRYVTWTYGKRTFIRSFSPESISAFITEIISSPLLEKGREKRIHIIERDPIGALSEDEITYLQMKEWFPYVTHFDK